MGQVLILTYWETCCTYIVTDVRGELTIVKWCYMCSAKYISIEDNIVYVSTFSVD